MVWWWCACGVGQRYCGKHNLAWDDDGVDKADYGYQWKGCEDVASSWTLLASSGAWGRPTGKALWFHLMTFVWWQAWSCLSRLLVLKCLRTLRVHSCDSCYGSAGKHWYHTIVCYMCKYNWDPLPVSSASCLFRPATLSFWLPLSKLSDNFLSLYRWALFSI